MSIRILPYPKKHAQIKGLTAATFLQPYNYQKQTNLLSAEQYNGIMTSTKQFLKIFYITDDMAI